MLIDKRSHTSVCEFRNKISTENILNGFLGMAGVQACLGRYKVRMNIFSSRMAQ